MTTSQYIYIYIYIYIHTQRLICLYMGQQLITIQRIDLTTFAQWNAPMTIYLSFYWRSFNRSNSACRHDRVLTWITTKLNYLTPTSFEHFLKSFCYHRGYKLATSVKCELKVPFSIATTPRCRGGHNSISWIALLYPWSVPYDAEC